VNQHSQILALSHTQPPLWLAQPPPPPPPRGSMLTTLMPPAQVSMFDQHGVRDPRSFSLGEECAQDGILECCVYSQGLVALTKRLALWGISDLADPRPRKLATPKIDQPPTAMAVIEPRHTLSGGVEVGKNSAFPPCIPPAHSMESILLSWRIYDLYFTTDNSSASFCSACSGCGPCGGPSDP